MTTEPQVICRSCNGSGRTYVWPKMRGPMPPWIDPEEYGCRECRSTGAVEYGSYYETVEEVPEWELARTAP